jgi:protein TonB
MSEKYKHSDQLEDVLRYMNNSMPETERYKFERELERDPFLQEAFDGLSELKASEIDRDIRGMDVISGKKRFSVGGLKYLAYAAGVALFIFAGFWAYQNIDFSKQQTAKSDTDVENNELREPYKPASTDTLKSDSTLQLIADAALNEESDIQAPPPITTVQLPKTEKSATVKDAAKKKSVLADAGKQAAVKPVTVSDMVIIADEVAESAETAPSISESESISESREDMEEPLNALKRPGVNASPQPLGGNSLFKEYLDKNARYPQGIQNAKKESVKVKFKISKVGQPYEIVVEKSPDQEFSREAIRLILEGPKWSPEIKDGIPVEGEVSIRVNFKPND